MTYRGRVRNGVVVLDDGAILPDGAEVRVELDCDVPPATLAERFRDVIGKATSLPEDMAENHDRYIHGASRQ